MPGSIQLPGATQPFTTDASANSVAQRDSAGGLTAAHFLSTGRAPTAAAGANAGTSPPAPIVAAGSTDTRGSLTCGTGSSATAGDLVDATFNVAFAAAPAVMIVPLNAASAALAPYVSGVSTTGFSISTQGTPTASQANTAYAFAWVVIG